MSHTITGWLSRIREWWRSQSAGALAPGAKYRELFENVPDAVYETSPDGRILAANPAMVRLLGFDSEAQLKQNVTVAGIYVDRQRHLVAMRELESADHCATLNWT